jgi:hypothetical protein
MQLYLLVKSAKDVGRITRIRPAICKQGMKQQTRNARIVRTEVQELKDILTRFPSFVSRDKVSKHKHMHCRIWCMIPFVPSLLVEIFGESFFDQSQSSCNILMVS